jgi:hypothetical protein
MSLNRRHGQSRFGGVTIIAPKTYLGVAPHCEFVGDFLTSPR